MVRDVEFFAAFFFSFLKRKLEEPRCICLTMRFTKLLMTMLPAVPPWVVPGENVENPGGVDNVNPLDTLSSDIHEWGGRVRAPGPWKIAAARRHWGGRAWEPRRTAPCACVEAPGDGSQWSKSPTACALRPLYQRTVAGLRAPRHAGVKGGAARGRGGAWRWPMGLLAHARSLLPRIAAHAAVRWKHRQASDS